MFLAPDWLGQTINPGWTLAGVVVNPQNSSAPAVEQSVLSHHSYGRQLGRLMDAVEALLDAAPAKVANDPRAVYYDATWMAFCGQDVPARVREVWEAVKGARDAAVAFVTESVAGGRTIHGYEVDDVSRGYIEARGFGPYFLHRTGHSIGYEVHGNGVNIDNLETRDERTLIPGVCFSIEPGIYLPEFGVRSEIDMYVSETAAEVTGDIQRELLLLA